LNNFEDRQNLTHHKLSIVVPMYNEEANVQPFIYAINNALENYEFPWELIIVDDGSSDSTYRNLLQESKSCGAYIRVLGLQRNFGQTAGMQAGIDAARGDVIVTLDGDMQNDPADIPRLVERLLVDELDMVAGWRKDRKDALLLRKFPSRIANRLISRLTGVHLHDYGCSLKAYRASLLKSVRLYGEMHRFIPAWIATATSPDRICEEVVNHSARERGVSKYGISRTFRVILDMILMYFFMRFSTRPGHFFGTLGLLFGALGGGSLAYLSVIKLMGSDIGQRPLLIIGVLLVMMSVQFILTGVQSEMISRIYYSAKENKSYVLRQENNMPIAEDIGWKTL
jgi:glycosyltransferase involved in cell wall biosynthesis